MAQQIASLVVTPQLAAIRDKAKRLHEQGKLREALEAHDEALALAPAAVGVLVSAGRLAHDLGQQERSLGYFEEAVRLDPRCLVAVDCARMICLGAGLYRRAATLTAQAQQLGPSDVAQVALALAVPAIAQSIEDIGETRSRYERALDVLLASAFHLDAPDGVLGTSAFFLAYHGREDRELQSKLARLMLHAIPSLAMTAPHCLTPRKVGGRVRIGFISRFFHQHSIFSTSIGLIEHLSRERFDVYALRITRSRDDEATLRIRRAADHALDLDADIYKAREQIAALELDILFYQDIGMEPLSYYLSFARLARVQCVSFGHPNTTGVPTMDYFISNDVFEPSDAQAHYSEKLIELHDLPTLAYYYRPSIGGVVRDRDELGLPVGGNLYLCPQTLYKLHPDFDALLGTILQRDPDGFVILIDGQFRDYTRQLKERFERTLGPLQNRVIFLRNMPFERFMAVLQAADVILDTIHFNGMNSSLEAFAVGTPVVTLPSALQRGRHTQAMYRKMGILDCIARDPEDYVGIALRLGTDPNAASELRARILSRNHVLYEDSRVVEQFEGLFTAALEDAPRLVADGAHAVAATAGGG